MRDATYYIPLTGLNRLQFTNRRIDTFLLVRLEVKSCF